MTGVEDLLRDSLRAYAGSIEPSPPPPLAVRDDLTRRRLLGSAAAVVMAGASAAGLWWLRGRSDDAEPGDEGAGRWSVPSPPPLSPRQFPSVLWTGREFLVWGGLVGTRGLTDGARYDPVADAWRAMAPAPAVRPGAPAVWANGRMITASARAVHAYDPSADAWSLVAEGDTGLDPVSDIAWTGTDLFGVSVRLDADGRSTLHGWSLDGPGWVDLGTIRTDTSPLVRSTTSDDQIDVHEVVAVDEGCVLWDGQGQGWRLGRDGWRALPRPADRAADGALVSGSRPVVVAGELTVIAQGITATSDDLRISTLRSGRWTDWVTVPARALVQVHRLVPVGDRFVVLGASIDRPGLPVLVDPTAATATPMEGYPIDTVLDQGAAWSGSQLLVVGGQRATDGSVRSTDDTGTVSAAAAVWTAGG